jgi:hypothetical protein
VRRIDAALDVAAVAHTQPNRNRAMCHFPRNPMGATEPIVDAQATVAAIPDGRTAPQPAGIRAAAAVDARPEPLCQRWSNGRFPAPTGTEPGWIVAAQTRHMERLTTPLTDDRRPARLALHLLSFQVGATVGAVCTSARPLACLNYSMKGG